MADVKLLAPIIFNWEGGRANDRIDNGGDTNMGVTLSTWKCMGWDKDLDGDIDADDLALLTKSDVIVILKKFWDRWRADEIKNQSIANILVDWVWASGTWGIKRPQRMLGLDDDGTVGRITLGAINNYHDQAGLFQRLQAERVKFVEEIVSKSITKLYNDLNWFRENGVSSDIPHDYYLTVTDIRYLLGKYPSEESRIDEHDLLKYSQKKFRQGWINRIMSFKYSA